jgi:glycosyltransferase involved in cell wall biosynthesis
VLVGLDDPDFEARDFYGALTVPTIRISSPRDLDPLLLGRLLQKLRADVVHTHLVHADVYGGIAAKLRGSSLVSTKHNDDPFRTGAFRHVERTLGRVTDRVIAITESLRRFTVERVGIPAAKVETIHYGLDEPPSPWGMNAPDTVPAPARVLLAVSRLTPQKGLDVAVRALPLVRERHPDAVLVVLGEGPERARLEADGVYLLGRVPDVTAWLRRADLLVHPARWEGFGLALLEAMLSAVPVVATRVSSIPEIVRDGETGILVPPDDHEALAAAIVSVLDNPRDYGLAGRARARAEFSVERMAQKTLDVYDAVR